MSFETAIYCDGCGINICCAFYRRTITTGLMVNEARRKGWSIGKYHLCPVCKKNRKKLKEEGVL